MTTILRWLAAAILLIGLNLRAEADLMRSHFSVGQWQIEALDMSPGGPLDRCQARMPRPDGIHMQFEVSRYLEGSLVLRNEGWTLTEGTPCTVFLAIDKGWPFPAEGRAIDQSTIRVAYAMKPDSPFEAFRHGQSLQLTVADRMYTFDLSGADAMISALVRCAGGPPNPPSLEARRPWMPPTADQLAKLGWTLPATKPEDGMEAEAAQEEEPQDDDAALRAEATVLMVNALSQSGIPRFRLMSPEDSVKSNLHVAWLAYGILGGLEIVPDTSISARDIRDTIVATNKRDCRGVFKPLTVAESRKQTVRMFAACIGTSEIFQAYFVAVPRPKGGVYVFTTMSNEATGDFVTEADKKLRPSIYRAVKSMSEGH